MMDCFSGSLGKTQLALHHCQPRSQHHTKWQVSKAGRITGHSGFWKQEVLKEEMQRPLRMACARDGPLPNTKNGSLHELRK